MIGPEVEEELLGLDLAFRAGRRSGQLVVEVHYHEGRRAKVWVRKGSVFPR